VHTERCDHGQICIVLRPQGEIAARFQRGRDRIPLITPCGTTIDELLREHGVPDGEVWICARNGVLARRSDVLEDGDVLEVISPVAGGASRQP
jgi:sulfur carrier protein ThiS